MTKLAAFSEELETLVENATPGVVSVEQRHGQGSGIIVANDGYIVTNAHVVHGRPTGIQVRLASGEELAAEVVGEDPLADLAVLRVNARALPSLSLVESRRLRAGQLVVAVGNPLRFERSVSLGVVSAIDRTLPGPRGRPLEGLVQTDAAINPGNSGGPLLDARGAVVGVNTAIIYHARGLGFAIPAHRVAWVTAVLIQRGRVERPFIGIAARGVDLLPATANDAGQSRAVRIFEVAKSSPAEDAGLRHGDLLLKTNDTPLFSVDDLQRALVLTNHQALNLSVLRGKERFNLDLRVVREQRAA